MNKIDLQLEQKYYININIKCIVYLKVNYYFKHYYRASVLIDYMISPKIA